MNKLNNITNVTNHCTLVSSSSFHLCGANLIPLCSFVLCVLKHGPHENFWLKTKHSYGFLFKCSKYLCSWRLVSFEYNLLHAFLLKSLEGPLLPQTQILWKFFNSCCMEFFLPNFLFLFHLQYWLVWALELHLVEQCLVHMFVVPLVEILFVSFGWLKWLYGEDLNLVEVNEDQAECLYVDTVAVVCQTFVVTCGCGCTNKSNAAVTSSLESKSSIVTSSVISSLPMMFFIGFSLIFLQIFILISWEVHLF